MNKLAILVGSLRNDSYSKRIASYIVDRYSGKFNLEIVPIDFPHYNEDLDKNDELPNEIRNYYDILDNSDGVIIITPEYNHSIPSVLKNAIDWASTKKVLYEKPALIIAGSPGTTGAARAHSELRLILETIPMYTLPGNDVLIGGFHNKFTDENQLNCEQTVRFLDGVFDKYQQFMKVVAS